MKYSNLKRINNKKATILIYTIILTSLALTLGIIVMNNASILILNQKYNLLNSKINNNINSKVNIFLKTLKEKNSDGGGFVDNLSGSGSNIYCRLQGDGTYLLEGDDGVKLLPDGIDDNCNDDNYKDNNNSGIEYPLNFQDNDDYSRKNINGLVVPKTTQNIFWNNILIEKFINKNPNNTGINNINLGLVENGKLYLKTDKNCELKIIEYNKEKYTKFREIKKIKTYKGNISGNGYIEKNGYILSLSSNITGNTYNFDFKNKGYMIFLTNNSETEFINYNLSGKNNSGKLIFLNPINDSNSKSIKFLGYDAIINQEGHISTKVKKVTGIK